MVKSVNTERNDIFRLIALGVLAVVEGLAVISTVLNFVFVPLGVLYPNIASVSILIIPVLIGLLAKRLEAAVVLTVLPFFMLALVYTAVFAPVWNIDLFQLGVLAGRVSGGAFLLGGLGIFGWMLRRILRREAGIKIAEE